MFRACYAAGTGTLECVIDRDDLGSWLDGPRLSAPDGYWPGKNLGLPEHGRGSIAPLGRRVLGVLLDWTMCYAIAAFLFDAHPLAILAIFAVENLVLVSTLGMTVGHWAFGVRVMNLAGRAPGPLAGLIRTALLLPVVPALISNVDNRGFHDVAARTVIVRR